MSGRLRSTRGGRGRPPADRARPRSLAASDVAAVASRGARPRGAIPCAMPSLAASVAIAADARCGVCRRDRRGGQPEDRTRPAPVTSLRQTPVAASFLVAPSLAVAAPSLAASVVIARRRGGHPVVGAIPFGAHRRGRRPLRRRLSRRHPLWRPSLSRVSAADARRGARSRGGRGRPPTDRTRPRSLAAPDVAAVAGHSAIPRGAHRCGRRPLRRHSAIPCGGHRCRLSWRLTFVVAPVVAADVAGHRPIVRGRGPSQRPT